MSRVLPARVLTASWRMHHGLAGLAVSSSIVSRSSLSTSRRGLYTVNLSTVHKTSNLTRPTRRTLLTKAYDAGPIEPPLLTQTIPENFDTIVSRYGDRPAVISHHQNRTVTYRQLQDESNSIACGLQGLGIKKGDRVAVCLGNTMEFAIVTYSLFRLGAILVPVNPAFTSTQIIAALNHISATCLIIGAETNLPFKPPKSNRPLFEGLVDNPFTATLSSTAVPSLNHIVLVDNATSSASDPSSEFKSLVPFNSLSQNSSSFPESEPQDIHDTINIQFTSGTTSAPKAAQLTHYNILNNGHSIGSLLELTPEDVICCPPPLFHCFGCVLGYMATATHGSAILFPAPAYDPKLTLEATAKYQATGLYGVPTMFNTELALLKSGEVSIPKGGFDRLRTGIAAGSSVPAELMRKLHKRLNLKDLAISYGMTETSPVSAMTISSDPLEKRTETVGKVMPHIRAKVVDPMTRKTLQCGERGELMVSGYSVMKGYYGDDKKTREAFSTSLDHDAEKDQQIERTWMATGDEASIDELGYVKITGRIKDVIIRGGENIHPLEVEDCILAMDEVVDVSVVGVKDEKYGEVVAAFVITSEETGNEFTDTQIRQWVKGRLSGHMAPKHVFFTDTFPKTGSGKVQKFALREEAEKRLQAN